MSQLNPNIILGVQRPRTTSPQELYAQKAQIDRNELVNRLGGLKVEAFEQERNDANQLRNVYSQFGKDTEANVNALYKAGLGKEAGAYAKTQSDQQKAVADTQKSQIEAHLKKLEVAGQILSGVRDQASWDAARAQTAQMLGPEAAATMPAQFDAGLVEQKRNQALSVKEQLEQKWKAMEYTTPNANARLSADTARANNAASNAVQMRGQNMTDARSREANAAGGKAPPGYRFKQDGSLEAIPGGPADIKAGEAGAKREQMQQGSLAQADRIIAKVDQALEKVGMNSAGMGGSLMAKIPGTEATNLRTDLDTIKANLGFAELQAMRQASPTGGALGAIAVQELVALQSTVASLDQAQTPAQLKARLGEVRKHYGNWKKAVTESSKPQTGGATGGWSIQKVD